MPFQHRVREIAPPIQPRIVVLCLLWYFFSCTTSQTSKRILTQFEFPIFIAEFQMLVSALLSYTSTYTILRLGLQNSFPRGTISNSKVIFAYNALKVTLPMGGLQFVGKLLSLKSTTLAPLATISSIRALSPLVIVSAYRLWYNVSFPLLTYLSLLPIVFGVILLVVADSHSSAHNSQEFRWEGVALALASTSIFAAQSIYSKNILTRVVPVRPGLTNKASTLAIDHAESIPLAELRVEEKYQEISSEEKPAKMTILFFVSVVGFLLSLPLFMIYELPQLVASGHPTTPWILLAVNAGSHFMQALVSLHILGLVPTVTYSVANMMKRIVIILVSILLINFHLDWTQGFGLLSIAAGLYCYDKWGSTK